MIAAAAALAGALAWFFTGSLLAGLVIFGLTLLAYLFTPKPKTHLKPASLADFNLTQANEGQPVPIVYGIVHIPGNIIFYGNLVVEEVTEDTGGKGGGGDDEEVVVGYKYYLDIWEAICHGKIQVLDVYQDEDKKKKISYAYQIFNDGTQDTYPTKQDAKQLEYSSKLPGIAHVFWKRFFVGENRTFVPTVKFKVKRILETGLPYENLENGSNPAAAAYDLLVNFGGIKPEDIDWTSFVEASNYFASQGLGINFVISQSMTLREACEKMLEYVDAFLDYNEDGKIVIKVMKKTDTPKLTIKDDFISFSMAKNTWTSVPNQFVANFVEDGVVRTIIVENEASQQQAGRKVRDEIDLTAFIDRSTALKRLTEIMKRETAPKMALTLKLPIRYSICAPGDVVKIINTEVGMEADFRVYSVSEPKQDSNEIEMQLIQHSDAKFDSYYEDVGGSLWEEPTYELVPFSKIKIVELDYLSRFGYQVALLILVSRETGFETGFAVYISTDGLTWRPLGTSRTFAVAGTLETDYPDTTYDIDDDVGFIFTPYKDFQQFSSISRSALFTEPRCVVIGNEIMAFQNYSPYGGVSYKVTGIVRGINYTQKESHRAGEQVFVAQIKDNIFVVPYTTTFYLKIVPLFISTELNPGLVSSIQVTPSLKARRPLKPTRVMATRSGNTVKVDVFAITKEYIVGAGKQNADVYTDEYPFTVEGKFAVTIDGVTTFYDSPHFTIERAGSFVMTVKHFMNGMYSNSITLTVGAEDGIYY